MLNFCIKSVQILVCSLLIWYITTELLQFLLTAEVIELAFETSKPSTSFMRPRQDSYVKTNFLKALLFRLELRKKMNFKHILFNTTLVWRSSFMINEKIGSVINIPEYYIRETWCLIYIPFNNYYHFMHTS